MSLTGNSGTLLFEFSCFVHVISEGKIMAKPKSSLPEDLKGICVLHQEFGNQGDPPKRVITRTQDITSLVFVEKYFRVYFPKYEGTDVGEEIHLSVLLTEAFKLFARWRLNPFFEEDFFKEISKVTQELIDKLYAPGSKSPLEYIEERFAGVELRLYQENDKASFRKLDLHGDPGEYTVCWPQVTGSENHSMNLRAVIMMAYQEHVIVLNRIKKSTEVVEINGLDIPLEIDKQPAASARVPPSDLKNTPVDVDIETEVTKGITARIEEIVAGIQAVAEALSIEVSSLTVLINLSTTSVKRVGSEVNKFESRLAEAERALANTVKLTGNLLDSASEKSEDARALADQLMEDSISIKGSALAISGTAQHLTQTATAIQAQVGEAAATVTRVEAVAGETGEAVKGLSGEVGKLADFTSKATKAAEDIGKEAAGVKLIVSDTRSVVEDAAKVATALLGEVKRAIDGTQVLAAQLREDAATLSTVVAATDMTANGLAETAVAMQAQVDASAMQVQQVLEATTRAAKAAEDAASAKDRPMKMVVPVWMAFLLFGLLLFSMGMQWVRLSAQYPEGGIGHSASPQTSEDAAKAPGARAGENKTGATEPSVAASVPVQATAPVIQTPANQISLVPDGPHSCRRLLKKEGDKLARKYDYDCGRNVPVTLESGSIECRASGTPLPLGASACL